MDRQSKIDSLGSPAQLAKIGVIGLMVIFASVVAYFIGTQNLYALYFLGVVVVVAAIVALLRNHSWVMILLGWSATGQPAFIPIPISMRDIAVLLSVISYVAYRVMAQTATHIKRHPLDHLLFANLLWVGFTFYLHPTGLRALGSETMGARPYLNIALATLAFWVILRLPTSLKAVARIPWFVLAGVTFTASLAAISYFLPSLAPHLVFLFAAFDIGAINAGRLAGVGGEMPRYHQLGPFGVTLVTALCAYYPPRTLLSPQRLRSYFLLLGLVCVMAAGFRNLVLWVLMTYIICAWLHRGLREIAAVGVLGGILVGLVLIGQGRLFELPETAQRSLAFLPGKWSSEVLANVEESNDSRFEWWKTVIREGLIKNWWVGDGFGVNQADFASMSRSGKTFDWFTLTGNFHNGPLSTIRYAGVVGLVLFYALMISGAVYAVQCVNRCRGSPLQAAAIFLAAQLVWSPFHYTLVFGAYDNQLPMHIILLGMLRLLIRLQAETAAISERHSAPNRSCKTNASDAEFANHAAPARPQSAMKLRIAWLAPYPVHTLVPELLLARTPAAAHPCSWIVHLSEALARRPDIELHLLTLSPLVRSTQQVTRNGITFHVIKSGLPLVARGYPSYFPLDLLTHFRGNVRRLKNTLRILAPDIVHGHGTEAAYGLAAVEFSPDCLISIQGIITEYQKTNPCFRFQVVQRYEQEVIRRARFFTCRTHFDSGFVRSLNATAQIFTVHEAMNPLFFENHWEPHGDPGILFVGSMERRKGLHVLLAALATVKKDIPEAHLRVVGGGDPTSFQTLAAQLGVASCVEFLGFQPANVIAELHRQCQVFVIPSENENSPNSLAEAIVSGIPVIGTDAGGVASMIHDNETGFLVKWGDSATLAKKLIELLRQPSKREQLSAAAKLVAQERHRPDSVAERTIQAYRTMCSQKLM